MGKKIIAVLEQDNDKIKEISLQLLAAAGHINKDSNRQIEAVIFCSKNFDKTSIKSNSDFTLTVIEDDSFKNPFSFNCQNILLNFVLNTDTEIILFGDTFFGKELASFISAKTNSGIVTGCTGFIISDNEIKAKKNVYSGKAVAEIKASSSIKLFTLRFNAFSVAGNLVSPYEISVNKSAPQINNYLIKNISANNIGNLSDSKVIVAGGRGMTSPENFRLIEELASFLGGSAAASRAAVDAGWRPQSEQVGQTGISVSPDLYIAVGISEAVQHLAGMRNSKKIIAINKDKDAPIFRYADFGIIGDAMEVLPNLIEEIKNRQS
ncbi:MAG: electron transfer flavoprotein subunit alpha/FixB family protein [Ignavibacteria bacterium]|nr:electron transfer flavoprotein subunit alpha/FixB family protein [Ignavibacteria bacterium]